MPTYLTNQNIEFLLNELLKQGYVQPSSELIKNLRIYLEELYSWNQRINLTGLKSMEEMAIKHIGDTLVLNRFLPEGVHRVLDIGTGAGVPGLILKLFRSNLEIFLIDSVQKKISFLNFVIAHIGLKGIWTEHHRLGFKDTPEHFPPEGFDLIVSQAFGSLDKLASMARPLLSASGLVIALKGPKAKVELRERIEYLKRYDWRVNVIKTKTPVGNFRRNLIMLRK